MGEATGAVWSKWQWRALLALTLVIASFSSAVSLSHVARASGVLRDWNLDGNPYGLTIDYPAGTPEGWFRVIEVVPRGAGARAGFRQGDLLRPESGLPPNARLAPGVRLPTTVERDGIRFSVEMVVPAQPPLPDGVRLTFGLRGLAGLVTTGLGIVLLLMRGRRNRAAATLGMVLQCLGWTGAFGSVWHPAPIVAHVSPVLSGLTIACLCCFLPLAGLTVSGGPRSAKEGRLVYVMAALLAAIMLGIWILGLSLPWVAGFIPWVVLAALLCFGCIARNYRRNDAPARNRIKIVLLAFACYIAYFVVFVWFIETGAPPRLVWVANASIVGSLAGPAFIAYAMLRHRLFDLNFALNRTLVYGAVSFILLATFGLAEWGVEQLHLIPEEWHEGGTVVSAGIALALFLSFHRLRDWIEHHIERLLFHSWHRNEAELRRFVAAAAHYDRASALYAAFAAELSRFARGAGSALYSREADGAWRLQAGELAGAGATSDADDHALALMRAERGAVELVGARSALPGALALPMLDQGRLSGFALLAAKPDGAAYRPDEVEALGSAAREVGLDLQAMNARELEAKLTGLGQLNAALTAENERLTALLARGSETATA